MALFGEFAGGRGEEAVFYFPQLEEKLVIGTVRLAGLFFSGRKEAVGRNGKEGLAIEGSISDGTGSADRAEYVELVGVKQDPGFEGGGRFAIIAVAVGADAVLDGSDAFGRPAFGSEDFGGKLSRRMVVVGALRSSGGGAFSIVEEGSGMHDLQIGAFGARQAFRHAVDAQDMVIVVNGVGAGIPGAGFL